MFETILPGLLFVSGTGLLVCSLPALRRERGLLAFSLLGGLCFVQALLLLLLQPHVPAKMAVPVPADEAVWSAGGTLQQSPWAQWRAATPANQLASAADLLKQLRREQHFGASIRSEADYRPWALALLRCLEDKQPGAENPISDAARQCAEREGLKAYLRPSSSL